MASLSEAKAAWQRKLVGRGHVVTWRYQRGSSPFYTGTCRNCGGRVEVDDMGAHTQNLGWGHRVRRCSGPR